MKHFAYEDVPAGFSHCSTDVCPKGEDCLRRIAYQHMPLEIESIQVINPKKIASIDKNGCPHFLEVWVIRYAKGFAHVFDVIPHNQAKKLRNDLIACFGRTMFYRNLRNERLIHPDEQRRMQQIFEDDGFPDLLTFSVYVDRFQFRK